MVAFFNAGQVVFKRQVHIQHHHVAARHHERADLPVVQPEHVAHHGVLVRFDHARRGALGQHGVDLFFGHGLVAVVFDAHHLQQAVGRDGQQAHKGFGGTRQPVNRPRHQPRQRFGVRLANALGHQFTDHNGEISDQQHHQTGGAIGVVRLGNT